MRNLNAKSLYFIATAAALIIFLGFTQITDSSDSTSRGGKISEMDKFAYPMFSSESDQEVKEVFSLCSKEKFDAAIQMIDAKEHADDPRFRFAKAFCYLKMEELEKAELLFSNLLEEGFPFIQDQSIWYLAVTNLKMNNVKKAQNYLEILAGQPTSDFHMEALNLLEQLASVSIAELM